MIVPVRSEPDFALFAYQYHRKYADMLGLDVNDVCREQAKNGYWLSCDYLKKLAQEERRTGRSDLMSLTERRLAAQLEGEEQAANL